MSFSDVVRREFKTSDEERDRGLTTPENVIRFDNICYAGKQLHENAAEGGIQYHRVLGAYNDMADELSGEGITESELDGNRDKDSVADRWNYLDVYRPEIVGDMRISVKDKLPVIVNVHGGGWVYGDKDVYQYYCMNLCQRGFAVVNFSYRLAPEYKFPAQLEDTNLAFFWVLNNADRYGFDTDRIYAVGDSAGANILALYCIMCTNEEYAAKYAFRVPKRGGYVQGEAADIRDSVVNSDNNIHGNFVPRAIGLNCGAYDLTASKREMKGFIYELMPEHGTSEEIELLNVTRYINRNFPPTFLMTCYGDFLKSQAPLLEEKLADAGIEYVSRFYGDESNPLGHVFHCNIRLPEAKMCNDETCEFFRLK